jgi:hypothetical protein
MTKKKTVKKQKVVTAKKKTYVSIVLDQSGSMSSIWDDTIGSFNTQIHAIKEAAKGTDTLVSLTLFNNNVTIKHFAEPVETLVELSRISYKPDGGTAMYDAIGLTIDRMQKEIKDIDDPNVAILFVIITDGQENSSRTVSAGSIGEMIKSLNKTKRWTYSVLGANIDLEALAGTLNINTSNMAKYTSDQKGMRRGLAVTTQSYGRYFKSRNSVDDVASASISANFYNETGDGVTDTTADIDVKK